MNYRWGSFIYPFIHLFILPFFSPSIYPSIYPTIHFLRCFQINFVWLLKMIYWLEDWLIDWFLGFGICLLKTWRPKVFSSISLHLTPSTAKLSNLLVSQLYFTRLLGRFAPIFHLHCEHVLILSIVKQILQICKKKNFNKFLIIRSPINLSWGHARSYKKFGPDGSVLYESVSGWPLSKSPS